MIKYKSATSFTHFHYLKRYIVFIKNIYPCQFSKKGIKRGDKIYFIQGTSIVATVISKREVEYEGDRYLLSPLTRKIFERKGYVAWA